MQFSRAHKVCSYLTASTAVMTLLLSPDAGALTTVLALAGVGLSWFADSPRYPTERLTAAWNIATLLFLFYLVTSVLRGESAIDAGVSFLLFVLINKLFNRRSSRDYMQAYVVSFLMVVAATTLNTGLSYAICFVLYVVFTTWTMILFHLRREMEENYVLKHSDDGPSERVEVERILNSRRVVGRGFFFGTSLLSAGILLGAALIFVFFPRIGFGYFIGAYRGGSAMVGFREQVELGHHGRVRDNPSVVMRVVLSEGALPTRLLWRGSAFDTYKRGSWTQSPVLRGRRHSVGWTDGLYQINPAPGLPVGLSPAELRRRLLRQEIYLEPLDSTLIFGADRPVAIEVPRRKIGGRPMFVPLRAPLAEIRARRPRASGVRYVAYSHTARPAVAQLKRAPPPRRAHLEHFLQLPADLPSELSALARRITRGRRSTYDKVIAVQRYLRSNYRYTLDLKHEQGADPIHEFLFVNRAGHCEYFASAAALLLRAVGVHTRNVNGFAGGAWNAYGRYLAIRQGDAHAWIEVLFGGIGWVAFDPTPPGSSPQAIVRQGGFLERIGQMIDTLRMRWFANVVEYDLGQQMSLFRKIARRLRGRSNVGDGWLSRHRRPLLGIGALLLLGVAVAWVASRWRRRPGGPAPERSRQPTHPATTPYRKMLALMRRAGRHKPPGQTPREFASSLEQVAGAAIVDEITDVYYQARYRSDGSADEQLERLTRLLAQLQRVLKQEPR